MTSASPRIARLIGLRSCVAFVAAVICAAALAAPGAHGPDGEHLDQASQGNAGGTSPRIEAKSELFELVGRLQGGKLSILIDRYDTNEPVLDGNVEVETGALKAKAKFHADHGDYAVDDEKFLQALSKPGQHALVFTVAAGKDVDLLDGTLVIAAGAQGDHGHSHDEADGHDHAHGLERAAWTGAALLGLGAVGGVAWWRQRRRGDVVLGARR